MTISAVVDAGELRDAMRDSLEKWMPSVLAELARRRGISVNKARAPRTWTVMQDFRKLTQDQSPAVIVTSPGVTTPPQRDGDGFYSATWALNVFVWIRAGSYEETAQLVGLYTAAVRIAAIQHGLGIEGARRPRWMGERYAEVPNDEARTLGAGVAVFSVTVDDAAQDNAGPVSVPPPPPRYDDPNDPVVATAAVRLGAKQ